jgi:hypothetical protein
MNMNGPELRLASLKRLLADIHTRLDLKFGFRLRARSSVPNNWPNEPARARHHRRRRRRLVHPGTERDVARQLLGGLAAATLPSPIPRLSA